MVGLGGRGVCLLFCDGLITEKRTKRIIIFRKGSFFIKFFNHKWVGFDSTEWLKNCWFSHWIDIAIHPQDKFSILKR